VSRFESCWRQATFAALEREKERSRAKGNKSRWGRGEEKRQKKLAIGFGNSTRKGTFAILLEKRASGIK